MESQGKDPANPALANDPSFPKQGKSPVYTVSPRMGHGG